MSGRRAAVLAFGLALTRAPVAAAAPPIRIAIVPPLAARADAEAAAVEASLIEAVRATPSLALANVTGAGRLRSAGGGSTEQAVVRLARETGASRVLTVEIERLGEARVLYLQAFQANGHPAGATTVHESTGNALSPVIRPALVRLFDPAQFLGRLHVRIDVTGAELQIDGKMTGAGTHELPVGTHAIRVTHPQYRDFLRFVDVEFDKTAEVDAPLSAYPLTEGEMSERDRRKVVFARVPWWRSWWALTIAASVVTGVTAGAIYGSRPSIGYDRAVTIRPPPGP